MSKFKVGDKVRVVQVINGANATVGDIGKVHIVNRCDYGVHMNKEPKITWYFTEEELELLADTEPALASRHNAGKLRPTLFPVIVYKEVLKVFMFGATKYGDFNWQKGFRYRDCADSLERHLLDWKEGKDTDDESKLYHMAHIIANAAFLLFYTITGKYKHLDNRETYNTSEGNTNEP